MKSLLSKYKKKKELPVDSTCRNCNTALIARYCHNCGQDFFAGSEKTVGEILYNTADTVFAWDNKILKTLKYLIFYPGKLTKDFFSGKVIQYVYPAKLFWFITILFFASINIGEQIKHTNDDEDVETVVKQEPNSLIQKENPTKKEETTTPARKEKVSKEQMKQAISTIKQDFVSYIPYVMFLLVPFFALLLFMLFYKRRKYYANHMIFALHFHSFAFLLFTVLALIDKLVPAWEDATDDIMLFLPIIYLIIALYVAYRPSIPKLIWKVPLIMISYAITCGIVLVLFLLLLVKVAEVTHGVSLIEQNF